MTVPWVTIRRAQRAEADTLTEIAHAAKRHWGYSHELMAAWKNDLTVTSDFIAEHAVFCAAGDTAIVGFYALSHEGAVFELEHMWVDPAHMGCGVGAMLFTHSVATARDMGGAQLHIASDPNAEGFYTRVGAHRIGEIASIPPGRMLPLLVFDLA